MGEESRKLNGVDKRGKWLLLSTDGPFPQKWGHVFPSTQAAGCCHGPWSIAPVRELESAKSDNSMRGGAAGHGISTVVAGSGMEWKMMRVLMFQNNGAG
jgi:hypothetical protein